MQAYLEYMQKHDMIGPQANAELDIYAARERAMLIEDINRACAGASFCGQFDRRRSAWLQSHPDKASGLLGDTLVETVNRIDIRSRVRWRWQGSRTYPPYALI